MDVPIALVGDVTEQVEDAEFLFCLVASLCLICTAGLMSGLTLGLMSLDTVELEVLKRSGTDNEKYCAEKIAPVVKHQHYLLVTLLLINAIASEALPLFIDRLANPVMAVVLSVIAILIFGEIIPQAVCQRYGLQVGAYSAWLVRILMVLAWPVAAPVSKLLDAVLGSQHSALFRRAQLKALVDVHSRSAGFGGNLTQNEIHVISGALDMTYKTAYKSMTPIDKVFMLSSEDRLDERSLHAILLSGHSRIPVFREGNRRDIMGIILVKELVLVDPSDNLPISALTLRDLPKLSADTPMYDMLKLFETCRSHMALLVGTHAALLAHRDNAKGGGTGHNSPVGRPKSFLQHHGAITAENIEPVGIITIEDVIEELLQEEIIDETDLFVDNLQTARVNMSTVTGPLPPRLRPVLNAGLFTPRVGRLGATLSPYGPAASHPPTNGQPSDSAAVAVTVLPDEGA